MTVTIGLDVGGTKVLGVACDAAGAVVAEERRASPHGFEAVVEALAGVAAAVGEGRAVRGVGVGIAGLVDYDGVLWYSPNIPDVIEAPVRDALAARVPWPVVVDNDANLAALAETVYGAAAGVGHALLVTLGTGIGGGIVTDGRILRGARGFAGEIGHFTIDREGPMCACGERGHWEAIASGTALGVMAHEMVDAGRGAAVLAAAGGDRDGVTGRHVTEAAVAGDADALALLDRYADNVALGLAALANVLDPERIVLAGGLVTMGTLLLDPVRAAFVRHLEGGDHRPPVPVVAATLGEHAGAIGAAVLARRLAS